MLKWFCFKSWAFAAETTRFSLVLSKGTTDVSFHLYPVQRISGVFFVGAGGASSQAAAGGGGVWQELQDGEGRPYYYNTQTGVSQWEKPESM